MLNDCHCSNPAPEDPILRAEASQLDHPSLDVTCRAPVQSYGLTN